MTPNFIKPQEVAIGGMDDPSVEESRRRNLSVRNEIGASAASLFQQCNRLLQMVNRRLKDLGSRSSEPTVDMACRFGQCHRFCVDPRIRAQS